MTSLKMMVMSLGLVAVSAAAEPIAPSGPVTALAPEAQEVATETLAEATQSKTISDMLFLLVDKDKLRADLKTWPADESHSKTLMSFRIAIGKEEGDKQQEGDNKTPEGIYFAQSILDGGTLPDKYGPKAIPIDFPNPMDRHLGKTGYGIWLHGVEADQRVEAAKVTEGCVAFYNADILTLTRWLKPQQSVIVIAKDAAEVNRPTDIAEVRRATEKWAAAWAGRDVDAYIGAYHPEFSYAAKALDAYRRYKERVFKSYEKMEVAISDLRIFTHDKYAVSIMNQDFNGDDRYVSNGRKLLYWVKTGTGEWRIHHEVFEQRRLEFPTYSQAEIAQVFEKSPSAKVFSTSQTPTNL